MTLLPYKNKVEPIVLAELISKITTTPDAPNNMYKDWIARYNICPEKVYESSKSIQTNPSKRQLLRAKPFQRRSQ
jgi:hypothetical protein